jgi:ferredoxin
MASHLVIRKIGDLSIEIDRNSCSAFKACIEEAPASFRIGADEVVTFTDAPELSPREQVLRAVAACPVAALTARDAAGKVVAP